MRANRIFCSLLAYSNVYLHFSRLYKVSVFITSNLKLNVCVTRNGSMYDYMCIYEAPKVSKVLDLPVCVCVMVCVTE